MNYKERLLNELEELSIRIDRLLKYIHEQPNGKDITLEFNQLQAMKEYRHWLNERKLNLMNRGDNMKKKVFRERYRKSEPKEEIKAVKPKKKKRCEK